VSWDLLKWVGTGKCRALRDAEIAGLLDHRIERRVSGPSATVVPHLRSALARQSRAHRRAGAAPERHRPRAPGRNPREFVGEDPCRSRAAGAAAEHQRAAAEHQRAARGFAGDPPVRIFNR
jgi:hypothetical protein